MSLKTIHLTSMSSVKKESVLSIFPQDWTIKQYRCTSRVPEQPMNRPQIREGAMNRLNQISELPAISLETGIVRYGNKYMDITCVLLRTRFGTFEAWSEKVEIPDSYMNKWLRESDQSQTVGSLIYEECFSISNTDWYAEFVSKSRVEVMAEAVNEVCRQWRVVQESLPSPVIPATLSEFKGVDFLDIQHPLAKHPRNIVNSVRRLADRLLFDTVMVMDARGFLLCGEFAREDYSIVMARKSGKLPNQGACVNYKKEYGFDTLCVSEGAITPGARVVVIDDLIATGGTMKAAEQLVKALGGDVVAFIAPYVIEVDNKLLCSSLGSRIRFVCTQKEVSVNATYDLKFRKQVRHNHLLTLAPPSLRQLTVTANNVPVLWKRFMRASNIWFDPSIIQDQKIHVFLDPSNYREMIDVLSVLSILYRKDPKKIIIVIPFLEQATQDRVEFNGSMESLAAVDTLGKLLGKHTILTFDLHAEQSRFAFYDLRFESLVKKLWCEFQLENPDTIPVFPDEGASKRFGGLPELKDPVVFRKKRNGKSRIVHTDDEIVNGKDYVVIDDLVRSGGTMNTVAQYLKDNGAKSVSALFAHAPLEPKACANMSIFNEVWTSDSCPRLVPSSWVRINIMDML